MTDVKEQLKHLIINNGNDINAPVIIGVDPARYGSDRAAIVCRQGRIQHFHETYKIGCTNCELKWPKDEDGNKCRQDYLMMLDAQEKNND